MAYNALLDFMGAWFHQDFDIQGNSVVEIVGAYRGVTPPDEQRKLKSDIQRFLAEHPGDLDTAFDETFRPDVTPSPSLDPHARFWKKSEICSIRVPTDCNVPRRACAAQLGRCAPSGLRSLMPVVRQTTRMKARGQSVPASAFGAPESLCDRRGLSPPRPASEG
jgi:contact-dependent growth inhibition (CDI) system CdiI-like immunity protein